MLSATGKAELSATGEVTILSGGGKSEKREPAYLTSASQGPFDDCAATDRSAGSDSSSDADASGLEAARFFERTLASDLRQRLDCSVSGITGVSTVTGFSPVGSVVLVR